jgi:hypothetical protein
MMYIFFVLCVFFVVGKISLFLVGAFLKALEYVFFVVRDFLMLGCVGVFAIVVFRMLF